MNCTTLMNLSDTVVGETESLFLTACEMDLKVSDSNIHTHMEPALISLIKLEGDLNCSFFLCIPKETAEEIGPRFLGLEIPFDSVDMNDIVGELNNMLCGSLKTALGSQDLQININVPTVIRFESLRQLSIHKLKLTTTSFSSVQGKFWVGFAETEDS